MIHYRLAELLDAHNLTAKQVAGETGIREATLSAMRRGELRRLHEDVLSALCIYFRRYDPHFGPGDLIIVVDSPAVGQESRAA